MKTRRGMLTPYASAGVVVLLLALGAFNWKAFHLVYCKHYLRSGNPMDELKGIRGVVDVHLHKGMTQSEVARLLSPVKVRSKRDNPTTFLLFLSQEAESSSERTGIQISQEGDKYVIARLEF